VVWKEDREVLGSLDREVLGILVQRYYNVVLFARSSHVEDFRIGVCKAPFLSHQKDTFSTK
jgi:hypothetical protein